MRQREFGDDLAQKGLYFRTTKTLVSDNDMGDKEAVIIMVLMSILRVS